MPIANQSMKHIHKTTTVTHARVNNVANAIQYQSPVTEISAWIPTKSNPFLIRLYNFDTSKAMMNYLIVTKRNIKQTQHFADISDEPGHLRDKFGVWSEPHLLFVSKTLILYNAYRQSYTYLTLRAYLYIDVWRNSKIQRLIKGIK